MVFTDKIKVFISYASVNKESANDVCTYLEQNGKKCWIAPRDISAGEEYGAEIIRGIETSDVMVVVFSKAANDSQHVLREIERAVNRKMPLIVFKIEECTLSKSMEYFLLSNQWLDASGGIVDMLPTLSVSVDKINSRPAVVKHEVIVSPGSTISISSKTVTILLAIIAVGILCVAGVLVFFSFRGSPTGISGAETTIEAAVPGQPDEAEYTSSEQSEETTNIADEPVSSETDVYTPQNANITYYDGSESIDVDLDGDGTLEVIGIIPAEDNGFTYLTVNGTSYTTIMNADSCFWVCDIDVNDGKKELAVASSYWTDDYVTYLYRYYDNSLNFVGSINDIIDDGYNSGRATFQGSNTYISGDGSIETPRKLSVFQSWTAYTFYKFNEQTGRIEEFQDMFYPYSYDNHESFEKVVTIIGEDKVPSTSKKINLYVERDTSKGTVVLTPQRVVATATDDIQWVYIVAEDGTCGWLLLSDNITVIDAVSGEQFYCTDVFDNLTFYD